MKIKIFQIKSEVRNKKIMGITIDPVGYLKHINRSQVYMTEILNSNGKKSYDQFSPDKCRDILIGNLKEREKHVRLFDVNFDLISKYYYTCIIFYNPDDKLYYIDFEGKWYTEFSLDEIKSCYKNLLYQILKY